jgi:CRISPR-associated protein (TIGR03986 family)
VPLSFLRDGEDVRKTVPADRYHADRYTGWFEVSLTTLTPLYTRAALGVENFVRPVADGNDRGTLSADFFHRGDAARTPVLPGSSLRGMVRSVFEIMTRSKMEFVNNRRLFYRTFASQRNTGLAALYTASFKKENLVAGILRKNSQGWYLQVSHGAPMGFVLVPSGGPNLPDTRKRFNRERVFVTLTAQSHDTIGAVIAALDSKSGLKGHLIIPGRDIQARRWFQVILQPSNQPAESTCYPIDEAIYEDYLEWGKMAHGHKFGVSSDVPPLLNENSPAFALLTPEGEVMVIGANMMMALRYQRSIKDVVDQSYDRDTKRPEIDMTEAVFGRVVDRDPKATKSIKGRVFFEDATCRTPRPWLSENETDSVRIPEILSGPKPTAIQIYLQQSGNGPLIHWSDPRAKVSGYKRYWHRPVEAARQTLTPNTGPLGTQKTRIRPVKEGVAFSARIRFENLSSAELGALYAAIHLPEGLAHKFGMGKSLGLGSLKVDVTRTVLMDMAQRYRTFAANAGIRPEEETQDHLLQAYRAFVGQMEPGQSSLWKSASMQALAVLLSWDKQLPAGDTRQISVNEPDGRQWKDRAALDPAVPYFKYRFPDFTPPEDRLRRKKQTQSGAPTEERKKPSAPPPPTYKEGQTVVVTLIEDTAKGARVRLEDGTVVEKVPSTYFFGMQPGDTKRMKVLKVVNGVVKELKV